MKKNRTLLYLLLSLVSLCMWLPAKAHNAPNDLSVFYKFEGVKAGMITVYYKITLTDAFKEQVNKASGGSLTQGSYTWTTGMPLPNPTKSILHNGLLIASMSGIFKDLKNVKSVDLSLWNTMYIINMSKIFSGCTALESVNLNNLYTHNLTSLESAFAGCSSLKTLNIANFNTSNVSNMSNMFNGCTSMTWLKFDNIDIKEGANIEDMFLNCGSETNGPGVCFVSDLATGNILVNPTNTGISSAKLTLKLFNLNLFYKYHYTTNENSSFRVQLTPEFKAELNKASGGELSDPKTGYTWRTGDMLPNPAPRGMAAGIPVSSLEQVFYKCSDMANIDLRLWDTRNVTNMNAIFAECNALESINLRNINTGKVENMGYMFLSCNKLGSLDLSTFSSLSATNMYSMFGNCTSLNNLNLGTFYTGNATTMGYMFFNCSALKSLDLQMFNTENVTDMSSMFSSCTSLEEVNLSSFNTSKVTDMNKMFFVCKKLKTLDLKSFNTTNVGNMYYMFGGSEALTNLDLSSFATTNTYSMNRMFMGCTELKTLDISQFDVTKVEDMSMMFYNCNALTSLDLSSFKKSAVEDMSQMFGYCKSLKSLDISNLSTNNATNMYAMFANCESLESLHLNNFNTSSVINMSSIFYNCKALADLEISRFTSPSATDMSTMFGNCQSLEYLDLGMFNTDKVTDMSQMFGGCSSLKTINLNTFNTVNVSNMSQMFMGCNRLLTLDLRSFMLKNGVNLDKMFYICGNTTSTLYALAKDDYVVSTFNDNSKTGINSSMLVFDNQHRDDMFYYASQENMAIVIGKVSNNEKNAIIPSNTFINGGLHTVVGIADYGLANCSNVEYVYIPETVTSIGMYAFYNMPALKGIAVDENNRQFTHTAVSSSSLAMQKATAIGGVLFNKEETILMRCPANIDITSYTLPARIETIKEGAFEGCTKIAKLNMDGSYSLTNIGHNAFMGMTALTQIEFPESVTWIGDYAFLASALSLIKVNNAVPCTLGSLEKFDATNCKLEVPKGSLNAYKSATNWKEFTNIVEAESTGMEAESANSINVYTNGNTLQIVGLQGEHVAIYSASGNKIYAAQSTDSTMSIELTSGAIYIVRINNRSIKVMM